MSAGLTKVFRARFVVGIGMAVLALLPMPIQAQGANDVAGAHGNVIVDGDTYFNLSGVLMRAKTNWPYVVAQTGTATSASAFAVYSSAPAALLWVRGDGNVGVGTTTPSAKLHVNGEFRADGSGSSSFAGKVGIGTSSPAAPLDVYGSPTINGVGREVLGIYDTTAYGAGVGAGIAFGGRFSSTGTYAGQFASVQGVKENATDGDYGGALLFNTRVHQGLPAERMRINSAGNVVIGSAATVAPENVGKKLNVQGDAHFAGTVTGQNIRAHYQDVAEWVPSTTDLQPGTVVILNRDRNNEVMASSTSYDTTVAGVVSAQPGITLGVEGKDMEQIATTGRVKVRVDARATPVRVGDLLVTSTVPGAAMRSEPMNINGRMFHQPGTILGKALEPLDGGVGEILVLLSMQ
jgi:hypothetical protein